MKLSLCHTLRSCAIVCAALASCVSGLAAAEEPQGTAAAIELESKITVFGHTTVSNVAFESSDQDWTTISIGAAAKVSDDIQVSGDLQRENRTTEHNILVASRLDVRLSNHTAIYIAGAASFGAPLKENWSISAGVSQQVAPGFWLTLDTRYAEYKATVPGRADFALAFVKVAPGFVIAPKGSRVELSAQVINLWNADGQIDYGWAARGNYYLGDRNYVFVGASQYPETERGVTRRMTSVFAGLRHDLTAKFGFRLAFERSHLENSYVQSGVTFGLELKL